MELKKRIVTGIVGVPFVLILILWTYSAAFLIAICFVILCYEVVYVWYISVNLAERDNISFIWLLYIYLSVYSLWSLNLVASRSFMIYVLVNVVVTEISAMLCGKIFKGMLLCPFISPNKTVSGTMGAFFITTLLVFRMSSNRGIILPFVICLLEQIGDLIESFYKRRMGVKDTGNLLPGHGGFTDRMDGLLFVSIGLYAFSACTSDSFISS